jgi:hypothetical protein
VTSMDRAPGTMFALVAGCVSAPGLKTPKKDY